MPEETIKQQYLEPESEYVTMDIMRAFVNSSLTNLSSPMRVQSAGIQSANYVEGGKGWQLTATTAFLPNITLSGGTIKYQKTSFTDTASGYFISSDGFYFGSASDASYIKYNIGDGTFLIDGVALSNTAMTGTMTLNVGSGSNVLKFNSTDGLWLGNSAFASAPFSVSLAGAIKGESGLIGGWTLGATTLTATSIILDSGNQRISVGASNPILIDGANKRIQSDNYVSGAFGSGFHLSPDLLEVGNIACRGLIRTSVFQKDVISTVGGNLMVLDGDVLDADMDATDAETLTTKATTSFVVGDILRIKDGTDDEWLEVTAVNGAVYTVTRDKKGDYGADANPTWKKGATVVNYGQSGDGGVYMTASESNAPYLSVFTHAGSPWTDLTERLRLGNLNGYLGYSSDLYGIGIGDATHYLKYDPTNHLRIKGDITGSTITGGTIRTAASGQRVELTSIGLVLYNSENAQEGWFLNTGQSNVLNLDGSFASVPITFTNTNTGNVPVVQIQGYGTDYAAHFISQNNVNKTKAIVRIAGLQGAHLQLESRDDLPTNPIEGDIFARQTNDPGLYYKGEGSMNKLVESKKVVGFGSGKIVADANTTGMSIQMISTTVGYAIWTDTSNTDVQFSKTTDAGANWAAASKIDDGRIGYAQNALYAADANKLFAVYKEETSGNLYLAKSTDAGANWTPTELKAFSAVMASQLAIASEQNYYLYSGGYTQYGQTFDPSFTGPLLKTGLLLKKVGTPTGNAVIKIYAHTGTYGSTGVPTGAVLATSDNFDVSTLTTGWSGSLLYFNFTGTDKIALTNGTKYCFVLEYTGGDVSNYIAVRNNNSNPYGGNTFRYDGSYAAISTNDLYFSLYGQQSGMGATSNSGAAIGGTDENNLFVVWYYENTDGGAQSIYSTKSTDGGSTWSEAVQLYSGSTGGGTPASGIAMSVIDANNIWVSFGTALENSATVYWNSTSDGGDNWTGRGTQTSATADNAISISAVSTTEIYATIHYSGSVELWKSTGGTFTEKYDFNTLTSQYASVYAPLSGIVYVIGLNGDNDLFLERSLDGGTTFSEKELISTTSASDGLNLNGYDENHMIFGFSQGAGTNVMFYTGIEMEIIELTNNANIKPAILPTGAYLYTKSGEAYMMDSAGNETLQT